MSSQEYSDWKTNNEFTNQAIRQALFQDIYLKFEDDFDFIFLILNEDSKPAGLPYGQLIKVSNSVQGIGTSIYNNGVNYGSSGQLQAVIHLTRRDFLRTGPSLHELMHNWGNFGVYTESVSGTGTNLNSFPYKPHWGYTSGSTKGQLGGFLQSSLVDNGSNSYTVEQFSSNANGGNSVPFNEYELYLMGMIPLSSVSNFDVFTDITAKTLDQATNTNTFTANTRTQHTPASIQTLLGDRVPSHVTSQKDFKALIVVLTDTPLTTAEWDYLDDNVEKFSRTSSDFSSTNNFWEATNGLGTINMSNIDNSLLGVENFSLDSDGINIFPNPANDYITITSAKNALLDFKEISVINVLGETIYNKTLTNAIPELTIDLKTNSAGIYFVQLKDASYNTIIKKIVIE